MKYGEGENVLQLHLNLYGTHFSYFISIEIVTLLLQEVTSALIHIHTHTPTPAHSLIKNNVMSSKDCNW